nr:hypothetical protein [uncultured Gellertiella sp.]
MNTLAPACFLLVVNVGLLWLLMAAPLGCRTITFRRQFPLDPETLWQAVHPLGSLSGWNPSVLSSEPVGDDRREIRQSFRYPDRRGKPIVRMLALEEGEPAAPNRRFHTRIVDDSALDHSYWASFSETRAVASLPDGAELTVEVTDRYRGLAMFLFRYFALRRELGQLRQWVETGKAKAGGLIEHPLTQIASAIASTLILWPFFGLTRMGLLMSTLLTVVIVLHEFGHMLAYRAFGHRSARMIFVPLLGGLAIGGRPYNSLFEVATCALMGPGMSAFLVPITIAVFGLARAGDLPRILVEPSILLLLILGAFNLLNLLPIYRFDGGQVLRQVFPSRRMLTVGSFGVTVLILGIGWRIGLPAPALEAGLAVFTLMSLMGRARVKPREALVPMSSPERLMAGFGLYAAIAIHGYAIVYACDQLFT